MYPPGSVVTGTVLSYAPCLLCNVRNAFKFSHLVELDESRQTSERTSPFCMSILFTAFFFSL